MQRGTKLIFMTGLLVIILLILGFIASTFFSVDSNGDNGLEQTKEEIIDMIENSSDNGVKDVPLNHSQKDAVDPAEETDKKILLESTFSGFGMSSTIYLYEDKSFLLIDETGPMQEEEPIGCYEGELSAEDYNSFIDYFESKDFFNLKIKQESDPGLVCEGGMLLAAYMDNKSNIVRSPCVDTYTEETGRIMEIVEDVRKELIELTSPEKEICREGIFMLTVGHPDCNLSGVDSKSYDESELDGLLEKSYLNKNIHVYAGPRDGAIDSYHRKFYEVEGECHKVILFEFDGHSFGIYE